MSKPKVLLTESDRQRRINAVSRKLRTLLDPKRWTDPKVFQNTFENDRWTLSGELHKLVEEFSFTQRVGWLKMTPKQKRG